jgi:hypothetical protein
MNLFFILHHFAGNSNNTQYFSARPDMRQQRIRSLTACISSIWQTFGGQRFNTRYEYGGVNFDSLEPPANLKVLICVYKDQHVLDDLTIPKNLYESLAVQQEINPIYLGLCAHHLIAQHSGSYDYYCHIEDDLIMSDPLFFTKLQWFNQNTGDDCLLLPNRFEIGGGAKCFIDGYSGIRCDEPKRITLPFLGGMTTFIKPDNVYAGSYFLNQRQLNKLLKNEHYLSFDSSWIGPLESGMSLSLQKSFEIYKPTLESNFLEIQHFGDRYVSRITPSSKNGQKTFS